MSRTRWVPAECWLATLRARELFVTVLKARRALDRFPVGHRLRCATLAELACCARRVLARGPLTVRIADRQIWAGDVHVLGDAEGLCADLEDAGVRQLTLTADAVPGGVLGLAEACASSVSARTRRMRLAGGVLPGVCAQLSV